MKFKRMNLLWAEAEAVHWAQQGSQETVPWQEWPVHVLWWGEELCTVLPLQPPPEQQSRSFQGPGHQPRCWISPRIFNYGRKMDRTRGFSPWRELHIVLIRDGNFWGILDFFKRSQQFSGIKNGSHGHLRHKHQLTLGCDNVCKENLSDLHCFEKIHSKTIW